MRKAITTAVAALALFAALAADGQNLDKVIAESVRSYQRAEDVSPNNSTDLPHITKAIYVGGAGDVKIDLTQGGTVTLKAVPVGTFLQVEAKRVYATGTTATLMVAFF